jgi:hypothetical protein
VGRALIVILLADIPSYLAQCPLLSSQSIILGALIDWATLIADPSGTRVPRYQARSRPQLLLYSPKQEQQWRSSLGLACTTLRQLMWSSATLSPYRITRAHQTLVQAAHGKRDVALQYSPIEAPIPTSSPTKDDAQRVSQILTTIMISETSEVAMEVITAVVVEWLRQLPNAQVSQLRKTLQERDPRATWSEADVRCFALETIVTTLQDVPV